MIYIIVNNITIVNLSQKSLGGVIENLFYYKTEFACKLGNYIMFNPMCKQKKLPEIYLFKLLYEIV